jgi:hypothetical protein
MRSRIDDLQAFDQDGRAATLHRTRYFETHIRPGGLLRLVELRCEVFDDDGDLLRRLPDGEYEARDSGRRYRVDT